MRGEISSAPHSKRHPLDWYVDPVWCAEQLALAMDAFWYERAHNLAIWDPSCGQGNTLQAAFHRFIPVIGSDLVNNFNWAEFDQPKKGKGAYSAEHINRGFFEFRSAPRPCSIICNPPYSYEKGIAERFARHALELATKHVCILMPSKWLAGQVRYDLFAEFPPLAVLHLTQRPSMPPGDRITEMGDRAFRGGMTDYCWIIWDAATPTEFGATRTIWLPPLARNSEIRPLWERADA